MASISTADFKNGMGLQIKDKYYTIVEFQHVKP
ncbi:MAG: elongation factor P, partial [Atopobiaceae bacterium]|nr:elongation factor P [Atopobiaceae bacterium]